jgi:hypothetical protein
MLTNVAKSQNHKIKNQEGGEKKTLELSLEYLAKYGYKPEIKYKS